MFDENTKQQKLYRIAKIVEKYLSDGNDSIILKNGTFCPHIIVTET